MTQAKFAARMASKMKHRQEDKRTKAKDRWLVATGVSGLVVLIVHDTLLITLPAVYPHVGFFLRAAMTVNCAVLVGQLCVAAPRNSAQFCAIRRAILLTARPPRPPRYDYYSYLLERKKSEMPPNIKNFLQNPGLRNRFLVEAMIAVLHPPPTGYPMPLPQRGDCRMGGYGAPPERDLSPYCFNVYTSYVGLFMFARLYETGRVSDAAHAAA